MLSTEWLIIHNDLCLIHNNDSLVKSTSESTMELEFTNESSRSRDPRLESPPNSSQIATIPTGVDFSLAIQSWSLWSLDRSCHSPSTAQRELTFPIDIPTELRSRVIL